MNVVGAEAEHERSAGLAAGPDTAPLLRTLTRLRHDLVMIGRAVSSPLPEALAARLEPLLADIRRAFGDHLRASGAALQAGNGPPSLNAVGSALDAYAAEVASLRRDGLTQSLTGDDAEHFFALGFALEQMRNNFKDLGRCIVEWARPSKAAWRNHKPA
jgi:hypothetical protein